MMVRFGFNFFKRDDDMKRQYITKRFQNKSLAVIEQAEQILDEYSEQGYDLTLRQLYYQFVARDLIPNKQREYQKLGSVINDARLAGLIDWEMIEDRTRNVRSLAHWEDPAEIVRTCAHQFRVDLWEDQDYHVEVWIEKDALVGVIEKICNKYDLHYFSCRGYTSQSEMWRAAQRLIDKEAEGKTPVILHFGDHDPSGIDMSRDIADRLEMFNAIFDFSRIALNMGQIEKYTPPPNPAKVTDSRFEGYMVEHGSESWELDALEPKIITGMIEKRVKELIDFDKWEATKEKQENQRKILNAVAENWDEISEQYSV